VTGPQDAMRRELRVHRLLLVATLALLALLVLTGAAVPSMEELRARRIALLDAEGAPTAVLEGCPGGARLVPPAGGAGRAIELSLSGEGPALGLRDDTGTLRLLATIQRRGSGFAVLDSTGKLRAELRTARRGRGVLPARRGGQGPSRRRRRGGRGGGAGLRRCASAADPRSRQGVVPDPVDRSGSGAAGAAPGGAAGRERAATPGRRGKAHLGATGADAGAGAVTAQTGTMADRRARVGGRS
jgi:hypothetical protein